MYVFYPHGSKKISDVRFFKTIDSDTSQTGYQLPDVIAHDQEILNWEYYNQPELYKARFSATDLSPWRQLRNQWSINFNLRSLAMLDWAGIYDHSILIHSETNSPDLVQYQQNGFLTVYYWSHAIIARDWYRFAQHDFRLAQPASNQKKFLIYCRDWSHRREYRLKFLELLVQNQLDIDCQTSVMHINSDNIPISQYKFINSAFELDDAKCLDNIPTNLYSSTASASYQPEDFVATELSVVLETEFDGSRIHLTEKTLRPIACGHPFVLAAGPGALEYLKNYGFKTFDPWIDESYDQEPDSLKRLQKIIGAMKQVQSLTGVKKEEFETGVRAIAEFNKKHFFSKEFFVLVENELKQNLNKAFCKIKKTRGKRYLEFIALAKKHKVSAPGAQRADRTRFLRQLRQSCPVDQSNPQVDSDT